MDIETIGDRIRYLRKDVLNLTLKEMSSALNISLSNLGNIETDRINVTQRMISDICRVYGINQEWLQSGEGEMIPVNDKNQTVSDRIKLVRKTLNLSQPEFGRRVGVSRDVINNIERKDGRSVEPKSLFIEHLCQVYNVNPTWLLHGIGEMFTDALDKQNKDELSAFFTDIMLDKKPDACIDLLRVLSRVKDNEWEILGSLIDQYVELRIKRKENDGE